MLPVSGRGRERILFLMGPPSIFWRELSFALEEGGHSVFKINLNLGDAIWWRRRGAVAFRGRFARWEAFLDRFVADYGITQILYYADRQPYHIVAQRVAKRRGIDAFVLENGYLRPDWITLERNGMSLYSHFPSNPEQIRALAEKFPELNLSIQYRHGFVIEMASEICYNFLARFYRFSYPLFRSGAYYNPFVEYFPGVVYKISARRREAVARRIVGTLSAARRPFYLCPLQLQSDKQVLENSPFRHITAFIEQVIASFAAYAPADSVLLFKEHPHDNGVEKWARRIGQIAMRFGIGERVEFIGGGDLGEILRHARGCVLVNSTVGLYALRAEVPTKALGTAIYDVPGLTDQRSLDDFWSDPSPVDMELLHALLRVMSGTVQVKGSFYDPVGRAAAIEEIVGRLGLGRVNGVADAGCAPRLPGACKGGKHDVW
ncbi:capsule biosynthesis protein [Segnochrobactrum spirostomi]|nr:capsular biosynthesis protein [Segnochrobactrum spirostomi]